MLLEVSEHEAHDRLKNTVQGYSLVLYNTQETKDQVT
jgi:hypothetical protein